MFFRVSFALLATLLLAVTLQADVAPASESKDTPAEVKPVPAYELERMVVTPSRNAPQDLLTVPQSVAVVTQEALSENVYSDANQVVQTIPGITLAPVGGSGDSSNRNSDYWNSGFTIRGLGAQRALVLTDGVRQSGQGVGYGGGNLALYDLTAIERIEILKGPGSVLYGTDAFGGVIQLFTRQPAVRDTFGVSGSTRVSFDDARNILTTGGYVDVGDKKWGLIFGGGYVNASDPTLPNNLKPQGGDLTKRSANMNFVYRPTDNSELKLIANIVEARDIDIFNETTSATGPFFFQIPFYQRTMLGAEYSQWDVSDRIESWKVGLYHQELKRQFHRATPRFTFGGGPPTVATDDVTTHDTIRTTELQPQIVFDFAPHALTVGADFGYDTAYLPETSSLTGPTLKADANQTRAGLYAQDRWELNERNIFTLGARFDNFELADRLSANDPTTNGLSGSLGYTYLIDSKTSFYTTVASGFRSPDLDERYQLTTLQFFNQQVTVQGNPNLAAERSYSFDTGLKKESTFGDFELAAYYNSIDNFIAPVELSRTSIGGGRTAVVQQRQNVGLVDVYGLEFGWQTSKTGPWRNYFNISRSWTDKSKYLALPGAQFGYGAGYQFSGFGPFTRITPQWMGRIMTNSRDTVNNVRFAPYHTADLQVAFEWNAPSLQRMQLILGVKNIFNTLYEQPFFAEPQPGRGMFAAFQVDF